MVISPQSDVIFIDVPIEIDNKNQLTFQNKTAQLNYFSNLSTHKTYQNCTYIRKDGYIRVNDSLDNLIKYNYCIYKNEGHANKWYYAFIVGMEYINDNMTKVYIATDSWQTYQFDITYYKSFVEREICSKAEDVPGFNLLPEGLETGEFIENLEQTTIGLNPAYVIAFGRDPYDITEQGKSGGTSSRASINGCIVNNLPSGLFYYAGARTNVLQEIKLISEAGFPDDIVAVFSVPTCAVWGCNSMTLPQLDSSTSWGNWLPETFTQTGLNFNLASRPNSVDTYAPRNKKLLTYPFVYLGFTPSNRSTKNL